MRLSAFFSVLGLALGAASAAAAEEFRSAYTVSFMGLPVARSEFTTVIDEAEFSVDGSLRTTGLAQLFDSTEGTIKVAGRIGKSRLVPTSYQLDYVSGDKKKKTLIRYKGNDVAETTNVPPLKPRKKWVPLKPKHLKSAADPITATLVRAESLATVCTRTIGVYDGEIRVNLKLSPAGEGEWNGQPTAICAVKFVPMAGFRKGKKQIEYLAKESEISLEFAALGASGLYAPVSASIGTQIGTVTVSAEKLEVAEN